MRSILCLTACALICGAQASRDARPVTNPLADEPSAVDAGKDGFGEACAACHGANAEGGRGPNLAQSDRLRGMTDDQLFNTIRRGVPGTAMPAFPLPDNTIWQIATFLRSLSTPAFLVPVAGDVTAGREVYRKSECASCHMIYGEGGFLGPDLTDVAAALTVKQLRQSIIKPSDRPVDGFTGVALILNNGDRISGVAKNYSDYSIDVLDSNGKLHLLDLSEVREIKFADKSLMLDTSAHALAEQDLQNLIAFLSRQTVRPGARPDQKQTDHREH